VTGGATLTGALEALATLEVPGCLRHCARGTLDVTGNSTLAGCTGCDGLLPSHRGAHRLFQSDSLRSLDVTNATALKSTLAVTDSSTLTLGVTGAITGGSCEGYSEFIESPTPPRSRHPHSNRQLDACRHTGCDWRHHHRGCRGYSEFIGGHSAPPLVPPRKSQAALDAYGHTGCDRATTLTGGALLGRRERRSSHWVTNATAALRAPSQSQAAHLQAHSM
jgi:hypothetical protein